MCKSWRSRYESNNEEEQPPPPPPDDDDEEEDYEDDFEGGEEERAIRKDSNPNVKLQCNPVTLSTDLFSSDISVVAGSHLEHDVGDINVDTDMEDANIFYSSVDPQGLNPFVDIDMFQKRKVGDDESD